MKNSWIETFNEYLGFKESMKQFKANPITHISLPASEVIDALNKRYSESWLKINDK